MHHHDAEAGDIPPFQKKETVKSLPSPSEWSSITIRCGESVGPESKSAQDSRFVAVACTCATKFSGGRATCHSHGQNGGREGVEERGIYHFAQWQRCVRDIHLPPEPHMQLIVQ